ncbi:PREDICTED: HMG box-containing protein 1-like isoform X1 [Cyprinodon variegatus]|uniref:HMG box-containing protein 1-like isoform X1 n=1 Tax=Cyprinodon variegatus TaxID=28743 RepID=UPI000742BF4C|nr:PREDICTED: HMG box-containing protein 1-like isoform X1 [Cyprinodon variegatus]
MVWEVKNPPSRTNMQQTDPQSESTGIMNIDGNRAHDPLRCDEHFPSSPSLPTSDTFMEYDDLPDLQEVQEELEPAPVYQLELGVSHQERRADPQPPETLWLTQLAHIATGPQSPLLQGLPHSSSPAVCIPSTSSDLHSYARPPPALLSSTSPSRVHSRQRHRSRTSSECGSAVSTRSSLSDDEDMGWSFSCPPTAWHCFLKGTRLRFHSGSFVGWQGVEELGSAEEDRTDEERSRFLKSYGSEGLQLVEHEETVSSGQAVLQLTFDPGVFGHTPITARCHLDHPFYVKSKGWSSFYPSLTVVHYGIPCYEMEVGDTCLPPGHRDAKHTEDSLVFDTFKSYDFTPLDSSAVYLLSSMARRRHASQSSGGAVSPERETLPDNHSPRQQKVAKAKAQSSSSSASPSKCKRPMNAFMLFAKKFRVEYTQMYPGKDNRAISVLLGEQWKKMRSEERRVFTLQAKALADEQKRLNPDCWKRKRTNSQGCQGNQS